MKLLRIVPAEHNAGDFVLTNGTKVLTPEGEELHGVTKIVLTADLDDVWRAQISFLIDPPQITALEDTEEHRFISEKDAARLCELEAERNEILRRQLPADGREVIDLRSAYA